MAIGGRLSRNDKVTRTFQIHGQVQKRECNGLQVHSEPPEKGRLDSKRDC